jgi:hypothetical protein
MWIDSLSLKQQPGFMVSPILGGMPPLRTTTFGGEGRGNTKESVPVSSKSMVNSPEVDGERVTTSSVTEGEKSNVLGVVGMSVISFTLRSLSGRAEMVMLWDTPAVRMGRLGTETTPI